MKASSEAFALSPAVLICSGVSVVVPVTGRKGRAALGQRNRHPLMLLIPGPSVVLAEPGVCSCLPLRNFRPPVGESLLQSSLDIAPCYHLPELYSTACGRRVSCPSRYVPTAHLIPHSSSPAPPQKSNKGHAQATGE